MYSYNNIIKNFLDLFSPLITNTYIYRSEDSGKQILFRLEDFRFVTCVNNRTYSHINFYKYPYIRFIDHVGNPELESVVGWGWELHFLTRQLQINVPEVCRILEDHTFMALIYFHFILYFKYSYDISYAHSY